MKNYNNKYESEELKEITLKSNISNYSKTVLFIFIFIALSIALSFFIKYPEKIVGKAFIVSETQTNKVLAPNDGTIEVFIKERQYVKK
jgi:preprotein translocase subunit SecG